MNSEASIGGRIQRHTKKTLDAKQTTVSEESDLRYIDEITGEGREYVREITVVERVGDIAGRRCCSFHVMGRGRRHCCRQRIYEMRLGLLYPCVVGSGRWRRGPGNAARSELTRVPILDVRGVGLDVRATKGCRRRVLIDGIDWTV
jgi:hypothetical protein